MRGGERRPPLRKCILRCVGEGLCPSRGRPQGSPLRRGYKECDAVRNPPVTASPCQPPFRQGGRGDRDTDCHSQCAHWLRNDTLYEMRYESGRATARVAPTECSEKCGGSGRCGERTERCQWQRERSERVAAVKILSVRRKAAQKFWAPQQDHRPLRVHSKRCGESGIPQSRLCRASPL